MAEPGTVQAIRVSPVLSHEFAAILVHNATDAAVMLQSIKGTLRVENLPGFEREQFAYNIPTPIIPPNEYWIGRLKVPAELAVGTDISFESEVNLNSGLPPLSDITTLLSAIVPDEDFVLPDSGEEYPIRYRNDAPYPAARVASFQQVFFDDEGGICGFISADDRFNTEGVAAFRMTPTNNPGASTGGAVLGNVSNNWLAQWFHKPGWLTFELLELGSSHD